MSEKRATGVPEKLRQAVREDPKKAGVLVILMLAMLVLWGRAMMGERSSGPASASASPVAGMLPELVRSESRPQGGGGNSWALLEEWTRSPLPSANRNLFHVKLDYFAHDPSKAPIIARQAELDGFWNELAKSLAARADQRKERQILLENLQRQAQQLKIQTIMMGETPRALIDGELVGEGDIAGSFRVLRIESRRIVVEREGVRMEILMN